MFEPGAEGKGLHSPKGRQIRLQATSYRRHPFKAIDPQMFTLSRLFWRVQRTRTL